VTEEQATQRAIALAREYADIAEMKIAFIERRWIEIADDGDGKVRAPLRDVIGWRARFVSADPAAERPDRVDVVFEDAGGRFLMAQ
jgi:hypothetical protein